jgi:tyrosine-protein kinase Etk/Wzc
MSKQQTQVTTLKLPVTDSKSPDINKLIKKWLYHWPLFIIGVILTSFLAYYYIQITNPVYPIVATLQFKVPTASSSTGPASQSAILTTLQPISKPIIVENEIEVMQSEKLMYQVVTQLELWINYVEKKGIVKKDLYKQTPVKFQFVKQNGTIQPSGESMDILIKNSDSFVLTDGDKNVSEHSFSSVIKSGFGTWKLVPTSNFQNFIGKSISISIQDPDLVAAGYQKGIKAALEDKDAPFVNLSTTDIVPERGKDILNSLLALYQQSALDEKNREDEKTIAFINSRFDSVATELTTVEKKIEQYKSSQGITDITAQAQSVREGSQINTKAITDLNAQLSVLDNLEKYADSPSNDDKLPGGSATLSDPGLQTIYDKLQELQLRREQQLAVTPANNPMFVPLNRQINTLKNDFKEKIRVMKSSLIASRQSLTSSDAGSKNFLSKIPTQDRIYNALVRDRDTKQKLYTDLLELREEISLRYGSTVSDSEIVDDAHAGRVKWPIVPVVYALALILGLAAPVGLLFVRESLITFITNRYQIEDETGVPIIGELSYQDSGDTIVVTEGRSNFAIGEQFRVLRTNLYHLHGNNDSGRVTLFTSSIGGEGKSFVSANLAVTLAYAARKTIIIEMDLRKPKTSISFGLSSEHPGVSDYLAGKSSKLAELIQPSGIPGLDVLSCGPILPNPSELLEKQRLDELISSLREIYDDVIIDSPPIHLVTDAIIISRVADASLYVVRQGFTSKNELEFISEINSTNRFPKFNIVFNGIRGDKFGYGYSYSNSYYNSYNTKKEKRSFSRRLKGFFSRF